MYDLIQNARITFKKETVVRKLSPAPPLSIGSEFLFDYGARYPVLAEVLSRKGDRLVIKFSPPGRPTTCRQCGTDSGLSVNGVTGVVVCMTTGCGHNFGYSKRGKTTKMKVSDFTNA